MGEANTTVSESIVFVVSSPMKVSAFIVCSTAAPMPASDNIICMVSCPTNASESIVLVVSTNIVASESIVCVLVSISSINVAKPRSVPELPSKSPQFAPLSVLLKALPPEYMSPSAPLKTCVRYLADPDALGNFTTIAY